MLQYMYNIFQKQIYIKHYNIICASHGETY